MSSSSDKPFECTAPNCFQRFTNEDHLMVHLKKHDMTLALPSVAPMSTHITLDQTPTPTRFIKNCEELFQNPFDEAFKKASESVNSVPHDLVQLPLLDPNCKLDTPVLNLSPHPLIRQKSVTKQATPECSRDAESRVLSIQPQVEHVSSSASQQFHGSRIPTQVIEILSNQPTSTTPDDDLYISSDVSADSTTPNISEAKNCDTFMKSNNALSTSVDSSSVIQSVLNNPTPVIPAIIKNPSTTLPMQIFLQLSSDQLSLPQNSSKSITVNRIPVSMVHWPTSSSSSVQASQFLAKEKLRAVLTNSQKPASISTASSNVNVSSPLYTDSLDNNITDPSSVNTYMDFQDPHSDISSPLDNSEDRRKKFLERNRAAAARCRNKRKQWINGLEKKADELQSTNNKLQSEVNQLRAEVSDLKVLLMAHKDCPITLQQKSQGLIPTNKYSINNKPNEELKSVNEIRITSDVSLTHTPMPGINE